MIRPACHAALVALALAASPAAAQSAGGETLAPEVLATPGAAQMIRESAFARLQLLQAVQQLRAGPAGAAPPGAAGVAANLNANTAALDRAGVNQQALGRAQALAASRARASVASDGPPTVIDQSSRLIVNAVGSPVAIGNGNIVRQQVANSSAISVGAPAAATAAIDAAPGRGERGKPAGAAPSATSTATSLPAAPPH
jgi:hypothetical protein